MKKKIWGLIFSLTPLVALYVGNIARADHPAALKYYYPACPFWLYPVASEEPPSCERVVHPACAPLQPCLKAGAQCLHIEYFCNGVSTQRRYTFCLDKEPQPGRHGCPI